MLHKFLLRTFVVILVLLNTVKAWGYTVVKVKRHHVTCIRLSNKCHSLMGSFVMHFLSQHAKEKLIQLFHKEQGQLNVISSWADQVKHFHKYEGTGELHYSNAHDNPPFKCSFHLPRDCENGRCVVSAIRSFSTAVHNYTVKHSELLPRMYPPPIINPVLFLEPDFEFTLAETIKFLVHFVQDMHQPLHVTGRDRGGNDMNVIFNGTKTQLHIVWDTLLLEKFFKEECKENNDLFIQKLLDILSEDQSLIYTWLQCPSLLDPTPLLSTSSSLSKDQHTQELVLDTIHSTRKHHPHFSLNTFLCPEAWANEIDQLNCNFVWLFDEKQDLALDYYQKNIQTVLKSMAMGSVRLAALLDIIL